MLLNLERPFANSAFSIVSLGRFCHWLIYLVSLYEEPRVICRLDQLISFLKWNPTVFAFKNALTGVG